MGVLFEYKKNEFAENIIDTSKLTRQKLGNFIKSKILTAHIQAVRILLGAPDRTRTCTSETLDPKSSASTNSATGAFRLQN